MEFTNQLKKYVRFLHQTKHRQKYNKFIAEGPKICTEFLNNGSYQPEYIFATADWIEQNEHLARILPLNRIITLKQRELEQISTLKSANQILIVLEKTGTNEQFSLSKWSLYLDRIQDPGNMGAILRIADWYNIQNVYSSTDSVDFYNPKVVQAAMGAHNRLFLSATDYASLDGVSYGLCLDGAPLADFDKPESGILVIGNESRGISDPIMQTLEHKVTIPRYGGAESLNASVACGIACHCLIAQ